MPELKKYRIFISHAWEYNDEYARIVKMLDVEKLREASYFDWANYSVPEHDPLHTRSKRELIEALRNQIRPTQVVLILAGMYVNYSDWILEEIGIAQGCQLPPTMIHPSPQTLTHPDS